MPRRNLTEQPTTLLILGGTSEGFAVAEAAAAVPGLRVISSLAGRVASPRQVPGELRIGGFGGVDGLAAFLKDNAVRAVIDATHPFAERMGFNAAEACARSGVKLLRVARPPWQPVAGDRWETVADWDAAVAALRRSSKRVFLTVGRQELSPFSGLDGLWFLIRTIEPPDPAHAFPAAEIVLARGPFRLEDELALLRRHRIDTIVCKNSGGTATEAKLVAARQLGLRVVMLQRPVRPDVPSVTSVAAATAWLSAYLTEASDSGADCGAPSRYQRGV
jgi:precorrin-6A/cobalt-precorrin-6A reductase